MKDVVLWSLLICLYNLLSIPSSTLFTLHQSLMSPCDLAVFTPFHPTRPGIPHDYVHACPAQEPTSTKLHSKCEMVEASRA
ncbi:hypothetical protein BJ878DRAFT_219621 [Calycina marina]|uniref:Secreted protein n=1 Tax=Calycina marina TaxID=1763456 RepID=A0A9P8CHT8_9HELO|nr:hypothetical protein BJ878DRAFT_219621 [Calycina marina]